MTRALCRLSEIAPGTSRGFPPAPGGFTGLFALRRGETALVYVNSCPHLGAPLNWQPDDFLSPDGSVIVCATHGATFDPASGLCLSGPCRGASLEAVPVRLEEGVIFVPEDAGL